MRNSDDIYDSLFGWLLFIWLFFTSADPSPFTFTRHVYSCPSQSCQNSLALHREGLCSRKPLMCMHQVHASLSVLLLSPGPWLPQIRSPFHILACQSPFLHFETPHLFSDQDLGILGILLDLLQNRRISTTRQTLRLVDKNLSTPLFY